jgi:hypothetical protein
MCPYLQKRTGKRHMLLTLRYCFFIFSILRQIDVTYDDFVRTYLFSGGESFVVTGSTTPEVASNRQKCLVDKVFFVSNSFVSEDSFPPNIRTDPLFAALSVHTECPYRLSFIGLPVDRLRVST